MKVYIDKSTIKKYNKERIPFLYPILGKPFDVKPDIPTGFYDKNQIEEWIKIGNNYLTEENDISKCDYVVFPLDFKIDYLYTLENLCKTAKNYKKKVILFYYNDSDRTIPNKYNNLIIFRTSIKDTNPKNEFAMPGFSEDLGSLHGVCNKLPPLNIGYTGYTGYYDTKSFIKSKTTKIKLFLFDNNIFYYWLIYSSIPKYIGHLLHIMKILKDPSVFKNALLFKLCLDGKGPIIRKGIIKYIETSSIPHNIIRRKKMLNNEVKSSLRKEYIDNIKNSGFSIVMRGNGNYSYRLSEVLSLGKIPIFMNSECRLPFEQKIDYKKLFIRNERNDVKNLKNNIMSFYTQKNLGEIQKNIRYIYMEYFKLPGFYKNIILQLESEK